MNIEIIKQYMKVYIVDSIHIMNYIVLIDPKTLNEGGWVFPIIENSNLIISANKTVISKAEHQARDWMKPENKYLYFPQ